MTIMKSERQSDDEIGKVENKPSEESPKIEEKNEFKENVFSDDNLSKTSEVEVESEKKTKMEILPEDKVAFVDSIVGNTRFKKDYELFGGKLKLTVRSLTTEEVNALSSFVVKSGAKDSSGLLSGKYRKYLAAAQIEMMNGTIMPPLQEPLYETIGEDGKTVVPPAWSERNVFWENMSFGLFNAVMSCIDNFDTLYATLCRKAEDANFWNPDTP